MFKFLVKVIDPEIAMFFPQGDTMRIMSYDEGYNRLEFGYMEKRLFRKTKFIMQDYAPVKLVQWVKVIPDDIKE